jgi:hypothetical protein
VQLTGFEADELLTVKVTDFSGRTVLNIQSRFGAITAALQTWFNKAAKGVFLLHFTGDNSFSTTIKLVKE